LELGGERLRVLRSFVLRRKILTVFLTFVLMGCLFVPFAERRVSDGLRTEDAKPDTVEDQIVNLVPIKNAILSGLGDTVQLTNDTYPDRYPQIDSGKVAWVKYGDTRVNLFDGTSIITIADHAAENVQIDSGQVVWNTVYDKELYYYDGFSVHQLTSDPYDPYFPEKYADIDPQIDEGKIVWQRYNEWGEEYAVFLYTGASTIQLTDYGHTDGGRLKPQIDAGQIVWMMAEWEDVNSIFFHNGITTTKLADYGDNPQIDAGQVVWQGHDGFDWEIFFYNGTSTIQLTNNSYHDKTPQIDAGQVVWQGSDGTDWEIFFYNGTSTIQLTNNSYHDETPQIDAGHITWVGYDGIDDEIFLYTGHSTVQLTENAYTDSRPQIDADQVVWEGLPPNPEWENLEIFLYSFADIPGPPLYPYCSQGILHNYLTWDEPDDDGGADITHYNVYRGTVANGTKTYLGSSPTTAYNDTTGKVNTTYYYDVTADNGFGESSHSEEVSGTPRSAPFLVWKYPNEGEEIIFPMGTAVFNFRYDSGGLDNVTLEINGISFGSVWNKTSTIISPYTNDTDGAIEAVLKGYIEETLFISDSRNFTFSKLTIEVEELVDDGREYLGQQLYTILHDPNGDQSFSGFKQQKGLSIGVGSTTSVSMGAGIELETETWIPGVEVGFSGKLEWEWSDSHDFRWEITRTTELTSSKDSSNKDYIGPGYGDTYWGEAWSCYWAAKAYYRKYFNGTEKYEEPRICYRVIRSQEVVLRDQNAPEEWRARNPVHNGWQNVDWINESTVDGGSPFSFTKEVTNSSKHRTEFDIDLDLEASLKFTGQKVNATVKITFGLEYQTYSESEWKDTYTTSYTIEDGESTDSIVFEYGIDRTFGTPIFRPIPIACRTSYPLEHDTFDYIPPIIEFPTINYDTSLDGLAPCEDDQPFIKADIFDEGGIDLAVIWYSLNGGTNWDSVMLQEQVANPGSWQGSIPSLNHGVTVLWYLQAWDLEGSNSIRKDPNGLPYQYIVLNRAPSVRILSPNGAESYLDTLRITWSALDVDGDVLTYTLSYNIANTGWQLLASGVSGNYYDWDISDMPYCETVLVKVVADDGFGGTAFDESDYVFTIGEAPADGNGGGAPVEIVLIVGATAVVAVLAVGVFLSRRSRIIVE
jgi:hypothetical protein